ncbi:MAG: WD-40 repeat-containing protein, partial [Rhodospirillaceae bacterium]
MLHRSLALITALTAGLAVGVTACDTWPGGKKAALLEGQRISVLAHEQTSKPGAGPPIQVALPQPHHNESWSQTGGHSRHAMHHLNIAESIRQVWREDGGRGTGSRDRLLAGPVVAEGRVYMVDANAVVRAVDAHSGARLWQTTLLPKGEEIDALLTGGLAYEEGRLFVTTGWGEVVALRAATGEKLWRRGVGAPVRAAPAVSSGRLFVINKENDVRALATDSGIEVWCH